MAQQGCAQGGLGGSTHLLPTPWWPPGLAPQELCKAQGLGKIPAVLLGGSPAQGGCLWAAPTLQEDGAGGCTASKQAGLRQEPCFPLLPGNL